VLNDVCGILFTKIRQRIHGTKILKIAQGFNKALDRRRAHFEAKLDQASRKIGRMLMGAEQALGSRKHRCDQSAPMPTMNNDEARARDRARYNVPSRCKVCPVVMANSVHDPCLLAHDRQ
jgi:hypothetical protein